MIRIVESHEVLDNILKSSYFYPCSQVERNGDEELTISGICSISDRVYGVLLKDGKFEPVILTRKFLEELRDKKGYEKIKHAVIDFIRMEEDALNK